MEVRQKSSSVYFLLRQYKEYDNNIFNCIFSPCFSCADFWCTDKQHPKNDWSAIPSDAQIKSVINTSQSSNKKQLHCTEPLSNNKYL